MSAARQQEATFSVGSTKKTITYTHTHIHTERKAQCRDRGWKRGRYLNKIEPSAQGRGQSTDTDPHPSHVRPSSSPFPQRGMSHSSPVLVNSTIVRGPQKKVQRSSLSIGSTAPRLLVAIPGFCFRLPLCRSPLPRLRISACPRLVAAAESSFHMTWAREEGSETSRGCSTSSFAFLLSDTPDGCGRSSPDGPFFNFDPFRARGLRL